MLDKMLKRLASLLERLTILSFLIIFVLVIIQMSGRFLRISIGWTDELISCFTTWLAMLGATYLAHSSEHVRIGLLTEKLGGLAKKLVLLAIEVLNTLCGVAFTYSGWIWVVSSMGKKTVYLQIHYNLWYISFMVFGVLFTLFSLVHAGRAFKACFTAGAGDLG